MMFNLQICPLKSQICSQQELTELLLNFEHCTMKQIILTTSLYIIYILTVVVYFTLDYITTCLSSCCRCTGRLTQGTWIITLGE